MSSENIGKKVRIVAKVENNGCGQCLWSPSMDGIIGQYGIIKDSDYFNEWLIYTVSFLSGERWQFLSDCVELVKEAKTISTDKPILVEVVTLIEGNRLDDVSMERIEELIIDLVKTEYIIKNQLELLRCALKSKNKTVKETIL